MVVVVVGNQVRQAPGMGMPTGAHLRVCLQQVPSRLSYSTNQHLQGTFPAASQVRERGTGALVGKPLTINNAHQTPHPSPSP